MSWSLASAGSDKQYLVATEALTTKAVGNGTSNLSSEIDFIPPGKDFTIISNSGTTNLSVSTHLELFVATVSGGPYVRLAQSPFVAITGELDTKKLVVVRDVKVKGQYPYYKLKVPLGGGSVTNIIIVAKLKEARVF